MSTSTAIWRVRPEGTGGEGLAVSFERLAEKIGEGGWGEAVEVRGPHDRQWMLIEEHEVTGELVPGKSLFGRSDLEEAEMDMTPMIDIVFQLLIFFMLVASFAVQKTLDMPASQPDPDKPGITLQELEKTNIMVTVAADGAVTVDGQPVALSGLADALSAAIEKRSDAELVLDVNDDTKHEVVVQVLDAAGAAKIQKVLFVSRKGTADTTEEGN